MGDSKDAVSSIDAFRGNQLKRILNEHDLHADCPWCRWNGSRGIFVDEQPSAFRGRLPLRDKALISQKEGGPVVQHRAFFRHWVANVASQSPY